MVKPVTLACGHSGCQNCLTMLLSTESSPKCPLCKKRLNDSTTLYVNVALNDITAKLDIQCTNSGCQLQGKLDNHIEHASTCGKMPIKCRNRGCSKVMTREEMAIHISQCEKQDIPCRDCGKSVTRDSLKEHIDSLCSHKRIPCPLSCGANLPRYDILNVIYLVFHFVLRVALVTMSLGKKRPLGSVVCSVCSKGLVVPKKKRKKN